MKKIIYTILLINFLIAGCEDPLDKEPLNLISEDGVWKDETLIDLYFADLYSRCEFFLAPRVANFGMSEAVNSGFCRTWGPWPQGYQHTSRVLTADQSSTYAVFHCWDYELVRDINDAIEKLEDESSLLEGEDFKNARLGEAYFLRAWIYFKMVKTYGGVPLIKRVQSLDEPDEDLFVPRSSEEECYDSIAEDCDTARELLEGRNLTEYGRATEWAALALKSRAMLYAGSIGEFGEVQTTGSGEYATTLGITNANKYWQLSLEASKEIIEDGSYRLYEENSDLSDNFEQLFQAEGADNPEVIFAERYDGLGSRGHDWDLWLQPDEFRNGYGSFLKCFTNALGKFDFKDGRSGILNSDNFVKGDPSNLHSLDDFWNSRDPRAQATFYFAETPWKGSTIYTHAGTYKLDENEERQYITSGDVTDGIRTVPAQGASRDLSRSALHVKKRITENLDLTQINAGLGYSDFIVFRLAEIYLNYAEAYFYTSGSGGDGLKYLNMVRERAGMPARSELTQDNIRQERDVELMFEGHRYWDLRRWRTAVDELNGKKFAGIEMRYDFDEDKYEIYFINNGANEGDNADRIFLSNNYYYPIQTDILNENYALVQNPGY
ncbi:RagB/SusD family nutrient uptake outer membrane protein [Maribellus comscasis]|uniref:RagB/SusD family nutrient uptake outer membrane protein n=1 Tax=Maribellus comscasis TaxID=2681766 RepID=A0A6I6K172_9BACT|nr:RagB/SusD family nutrient uptake outer membrane protein [Maribellus comscasis]QGY43674.1 RagB/SusD family nutrient uptake outer membrane protein [Maribellus comscasis]